MFDQSASKHGLRMRHVVILGSTGSIGVSALEVLAAYSDRFNVCALTAARKEERFAGADCTLSPECRCDG